MKKLLLLSLLCLPLMGQVTFRDVTIRDVTIQSLAQQGGGSNPGEDWTSYFYAVWTFENDGSAGEANQGGSCSTACDMSISAASDGLIAKDGTYYQEGSYSRDMSPDFDFFYCSSCTGLHSGLTGDVSYVTRVMFDNLVGSEVVLDSMGSGPDGLKLTRNDASPDNFGFAYGYGTATRTTQVYPTTPHAADVWYFLGFAHDDGTGQAGYAYSGSDADSDTTSWTDALVASTHGDFRLGHNTNVTALQGLMDETGVYLGVLSANAMARICACGIDGSLCTHDGANWTDDGLNTTNCGSALGSTTCVGVSDPANCT